MTAIRITGSLAILACLGNTLSAETMFMGLGTINGAPVGISGDGTYAVGYFSGEVEEAVQAFQWSLAGGLTILPPLPDGAEHACANGVSLNGNLVVGISDGANGEEATLWTNGTPTGLGGLGGIHHSGYLSCATGIATAADTVIVGQAVNESEQFEAFRWTSTGGMVGLGTYLPSGPGSPGSTAEAISGDGSTIVGQCSAEACRWDSDLDIYSLGEIVPGTSFSSIAADVNADGSVIVGQAWAGSGFEAFRWTATSGMVGLGDLSGGTHSSAAGGVSGDGSIVVGNSAVDDQPCAAFIWDTENGMRNLADVLTDEYGLDLEGWQLYSALGISTDGTTIIGEGVNPDGQFDGWVAVIPEPGALVMLLLAGTLSLRPRFARV